MKRLLAIRHAKSDWGDPALSDHDRPLNDRGLRDAPIMAEHLKSLAVQPDVILSSSANRAITTAKMLASHLGFDDSKIIQSEDWYLASSAQLLKAVQSVDESANTVMIFGHNPGMHDFSTRMLQSGSINQFPTLAVADLQLDVEYWGNVELGSAQLFGHYYPKGL